MSIRQVNGIYACDIRRQGVPRLSVSLKTKSEKEAQRRHSALLVLYEHEKFTMIEQVRGGLLPVDRVVEMVEKREALEPVTVIGDYSWGTVSQQVEKYIEWLTAHPKREANTVRLAAQQLVRFENFVFECQRVGDMGLVDVPSAAILGFQESLKDAGKGLNVITTTMGRVGSLWRFVQAREAKAAREQKRPAHELYSPVDSEMMIRENTRRDRFLSEDELERLFLSTPDPLLFVIGCGAMAGLRMEEVLHLRPTLDVDVTLGTITIQKRGDPKKDGWKPKTRRSNRTVPMTDSLRAITVNHLNRFANGQWMVPSSELPDRALLSGTVRWHMQNIVERAGMVYGNKTPDGVVFHTLRHSFASHLAMRGVDLYTIAQLLGDSLATTETVYAKLSPDFKKAAIQKLSAAFKLPDEMTQVAT